MRLLIIAYHFPPDAAIGGVSPYQFARLLPEHGIEPWVLTVQPQFAERYQPSNAPAGVPNERILRTAVGRTRLDALMATGKPLAPLLRRPNADAPRLGAPDGACAADTDGVGTAWFRRTPRRRRILEWLCYPDWRAGWYKPGLAAAESVVRCNKLDAIVSTSPPITSHLIAHAVSARHGIPWVMDLRDPWVNPWSQTEVGSPLLETLQRRLFRGCAREASAIVANTERMREMLAGELGRSADEVVTVPNGCALRRSAQAMHGSRSDSFCVSHYGSIYGHRDPIVFLQGLRMWLEAEPKVAAHTAVRLVGPDGAPNVGARIAELGMEAAVQLLPGVPRTEVARLMSEDYMLLLVATNQPLQVPGKAYEYVAACRRILALADREGATADLLRGQTGAVVAATPEEVAECLFAAYADWAAGRPAHIDYGDLLAECSYERRTEQMAAVLWRAVEAGCPGKRGRA